VTLVSGGAAWADHAAVRLFLGGGYAGLTLHLPCPWHRGKHWDNGQYSWKTNPGRTANVYHRRFSSETGADTLGELEHAKRNGAVMVAHAGFFQRNSAIAKADYLVAFSWADSPESITGGTKYTWRKCRTQKLHVSLPAL